MKARIAQSLFMLIYVMDCHGPYCCLLGVSHIREDALRPLMTVNSAAAETSNTAEEDGGSYRLAPLDEDRPHSDIDDDAYRLLISALKTDGAKISPEEEMPLTEQDKKIRRRQAQREGPVISGSAAAISETEKKLAKADEERQFEDILAWQVKHMDEKDRLPGVDTAVPIAPSDDIEQELREELRKGSGVSLGSAEHLDDFFEVEAACAELAREADLPTTRKIARLRNPQTGIQAIGDCKKLFNKALGYLLYASQIGCDRNSIAELRAHTYRNRDDAQELRLGISRVLELIEEKAKVQEEADEVRQRIAKIRKQLPMINKPQQLFEKARSYIKSALKHGCDRGRLQGLWKDIIQNKRDPDRLKDIILEMLSLIELSYDPRSILLGEVSEGEVGVSVIISDEEDKEKTINPDVWNHMRHAGFLIKQFKMKWNRRVHRVSGGYQGVSFEHSETIASEAGALAKDEYVIFHITSFEKLHITDIIKLEKISGASETFVVIGDSRSHIRPEDKADLIVLSLTSPNAKPIRLRQGYKGKIKILEVVTPQEAARLHTSQSFEEDLTTDRKLYERRIEPEKDVKPYEFSVTTPTLTTPTLTTPIDSAA